MAIPMRIVERICRLENAKGGTDRMTATEIDEAASRYGQALRDDLPSGWASVGEAASKWRIAIEGTRRSPLQRVFATMSPNDWWL